MIEVHALDYFVRLTDTPLTSELDGEVTFADCIITIRASMTGKKQQQTFWHEMMHIILEGETFGGGTTKKDEELVTRISNMLYGVLMDNGLLVEGWWEKVVDEVGPSGGSRVR